MAFARGRIILISVLLGALLAACNGAAQRGDPASGDFPESTAEGTLDDFTPSPPPPDVPSEGYPFVPTPAIYRLSDQLNILYLNWQADPVQAADAARKEGMKIEGDRVQVTIILEDASFAELLKTEIAALNGEPGAHYETWLDAWIPIPNLEKAANLPGIINIIKPDYIDDY